MSFVNNEGHDILGTWIIRQQTKNVERKHTAALKVLCQCRVNWCMTLGQHLICADSDSAKYELLELFYEVPVPFRLSEETQPLRESDFVILWLICNISDRVSVAGPERPAPARVIQQYLVSVGPKLHLISPILVALILWPEHEISRTSSGPPIQSIWRSEPGNLSNASTSGDFLKPGVHELDRAMYYYLPT
jgi:hypothetical protein